jgi:hypothetical protein
MFATSPVYLQLRTCWPPLQIDAKGQYRNSSLVHRELLSRMSPPAGDSACSNRRLASIKAIERELRYSCFIAILAFTRMNSAPARLFFAPDARFFHRSGAFSAI